jgi:hypothetical protein
MRRHTRYTTKKRENGVAIKTILSNILNHLCGIFLILSQISSTSGSNGCNINSNTSSKRSSIQDQNSFFLLQTTAAAVASTNAATGAAMDLQPPLAGASALP